MKPSETDLHDCLTLARLGDDDAYRRLLEGISSLVHKYARRRLIGLDADVEDLVQDVLLAVHLKQHTYDVSRPITAWVHTIARYKLIDFWRLKTRRAEDALSTEDAEAFADASDIHATETAPELKALITRLPRLQQAVIRLVKLQGYSVQEAATRLQISPSAVKVYTHRGIKKLAEQLRVDR
jgi:RNA polymerase sigma-70 factor, ECF subfamily